MLYSVLFRRTCRQSIVIRTLLLRISHTLDGCFGPSHVMILLTRIVHNWRLLFTVFDQNSHCAAA
jgi:uncharacterized membrane protein